MSEDGDHWEISTSACVVPNRPLERIVQSFRNLQQQVAQQQRQLESSQQQLVVEKRRKSQLEMQLLQSSPGVPGTLGSSVATGESQTLCQVHCEELMDRNLFCIPCALLICHLCHLDSSHQGHQVVSSHLHHDFIKHEVCLSTF